MQVPENSKIVFQGRTYWPGDNLPSAYDDHLRASKEHQEELHGKANGVKKEKANGKSKSPGGDGSQADSGG